MYRTIVEAILEHGKNRPDKLAVGFKKIRITYGELARQIQIMAGKLRREYGIQKGDFVMITGVSKPEYVSAYLAIQYLGAVSIPMDKTAREETVLDVYRYVQPRLMLTDSKIQAEDVRLVSLKSLYGAAAESAVDESEEPLAYQIPENEAVAEILFTTGTTGIPKGTMLSIGNIYASIHNTWHGVGMEPEDTVLIPVPLCHSLGMRVMRTALYIGATVVIQNGFAFAKELENNIEAFHCTGLVSVPASMEVIYRQMGDRFPEIMGKLRYMEVGAGSLGFDMKKKLCRVLPDTKIVNTWGSTETGGAIFLKVSEHPEKFASIGKPIDTVELKVVDSQGRTVAARDMESAGRMVLRGAMQMQGYYHMPEATRGTLVDGWLYTNDMVYTDEDGYVYMLGRADDIINVGGEKVSPIEVENIAQEFEGIRECACVGVEDPEGILGQIPVLYVVPEDGRFEQDELVRYLASRLEKYKLPQRYVVIGELPRNRMKKLDLKALLRMWQETGDSPLMNEVVRNILSRRSVRDFTEKEIPRANLEMILQCGLYAPSGHNMQTWKFTVIQDASKIEKFKEVVGKAAKKNKVYFYGLNNPNALILISNDRRNANSIQDSACAAENVMLAANSYGIGSVWINALHTICDVPEIRALLQAYGIPDTHIVWATIAMGYPEKPGKLLAKKQTVIHWV